MSKSKNNLTGLTSHLTQGKSGRKNGLFSLSGSGTGLPELKAATQKLSAGSNAGLRSQSLNSKSLQGIHFGKPSSSSRSSTSTTSDLGTLLKTSESTGLSGLLSGGGLLGSISGLGALGSLFGGLFGGSGSKTPPPLKTFTLPQASAESYSVGSVVNAASGVYAPSTVQASPATSLPSMPSPGTSPLSPSYQATSGVSSPNPSSDRIAQAVKIALLNSSSLNDVINEI